MTIKHIVSFNFKENIENLNDSKIVIEIKNGLENLVGKIPGLIHLEVGIDINRSERAADMILYSILKDKESLEIYRTHSEHVKILNIVKQNCHEIRVVDYEG